jgi:hypothetical protein
VPVAVDEVLAEPVALREQEVLTVAVSEEVPDNVLDTVWDSDDMQLADGDAETLDVNDVEREADVATVDVAETEFDDDVKVWLSERLTEVVCDTDFDGESGREPVTLSNEVIVSAIVFERDVDGEYVRKAVSVAEAD